MEKNVDEAAIARNAARGAMVAERAARREAMQVVAEKGGRLGRRTSAVLLDEKRFEEWVQEKGGGDDDRFMRWFCGQIASGVTATVLCRDYVVEEGLLGAYLTEIPERLERYRRAKVWAAEGLVDGALEAAWSDGPDVVRDKLKADVNLKVAGKWNRAEYGDEKQQGVPGVPVINFIMPVMPGGVVAEIDVTPEGGE